MPGKGYIFDVRSMPSSDAKKPEAEVRFHGMPNSVVNNRTSVDTFAMAGGSELSLVLGCKLDLDLTKLGMVSVRANIANSRAALLSAREKIDSAFNSLRFSALLIALMFFFAFALLITYAVTTLL